MAQEMAQDTPRRVVRVGAYGLLTETNHILLCRISAELPDLAGRWTLPGGGVEFGEHPEAAMIREVHEETGLTVASRGLVDVDSLHIERPAQLHHGIRIIYRAEPLAGELTNEVAGTTDLCQWWPVEETGSLPLVSLARLGIELAFS